jgi:excisionase family DNA binding protein
VNGGGRLRQGAVKRSALPIPSFLQAFVRVDLTFTALRGRTMNRKLTTTEIIQAVDSRLPPILTPEEAAQLLRLKVSTLYRHASEGRYGSAIKRGKPLRFWRDRLIQEFML